MEFHEKLQELRKRKGLTQEEVAAALYVSRTAVSKWEAGRGYPNIDSLRAISKFYGITLDELLSGEEILSIAEADNKQRSKHFCDLALGLSDVCALLLLFLPLFATKGGEAASLFVLGDAPAYMKAFYLFATIGTGTLGILMLALQNLQLSLWLKIKHPLSLFLGIATALLFMIARQPYAAVFAFTLLAIKVFMLFRVK